ncbi:protein moonraker isoform X5 [Coregonus clupeaformis]|uniref:protein moonraker isoform X5 n=1 Tax=Coregonus clupeaformis TaxID=59861 RepID=UPI001BDFC8EA|nr:protein moonraker isoform X5 [Coregonus clupeaformis]
MAANLLESPMTLGQSKSWVTLGPNRSTRLSQTQLLFNAAMPANAYNRATQVGPPAPIVIEKLMPWVEKRDDLDSTGSSLCFSALSEERLLAAVRLAKRDLRKRRQESLNSSPIRPQPEETTPIKSNVEQQKRVVPKGRSKTAGPKEEVTRSGAEVLVYTPQKYISVPPGPDHGLSPPTRDPGPRQTASQEPQRALSQEVCRLQRELANYIQRIDQLANRGRMVAEPLEPDEQRRVDIRRQEQAARSARIIYVLQQQVKEIQEDLDKLRSQKIQHTKKSRAIDRLAAAHRGAVRAMQVFTNQLSDTSEGRLPSHYKELGQLIRQLSLCSAKVEVGQGSAIPETALDILQKLETLDTALSKQESPAQRRQARARSFSPARHRRSPHRSTSPPRPRAPRGPATRGLRGHRRAAGPKKSFPADRRAVHQHQQPPRATEPPPQLDRSQVLRAGLESLVHLRELREGGGQVPNSQGGALHPDRTKKQGAHVRDAGFQQPTVASRLRVCQHPQKEASVPWIPTSPHSPPKQQQRSPQKRPEPRCLFSPLKPSSGPSEQQLSGVVTAEQDQGLTSDRQRQVHNEALRQAWLDRMTMQRLRDLNQLSKDEAERIQRLRSEVGSPTQWAERAEQEARGRLQPLLDQALMGAAASQARDRKATSSLRHRLSEQAADRAAESAEVLSEALLEELLADAAQAAWAAETDRRTEGLAQRQLQTPTLESMLLRMEEMEKDQEAVRRRFATITYSDPHYWDRGDTTGPQRYAPGSRPVSPQPIRITRPALRHTTTADIVLESPVETGHSVLSESSIREQDYPGLPGRSSSTFPAPGERRGEGTRLSVPASMQRSIQQYRQDHEAYLRLVAHEAVGSFNPWAIADSLAEELMSEALADVAAEFQDVCEEYAEAVFTSEFLQPITSPPASVPLLDSQ